ncbi:MAG: hypothetical protein AB1449_01600 [Chloroflexota bacterium]
MPPVRCVIAGLIATWLIAACASLPREAKQAVLRSFRPEEQPKIHSAQRAERLAEDCALCAEEVWCVIVRHRCWSWVDAEWYTCFSSRLARRIDSAWRVDPVLSADDWENWAARGCPREPEIIGMAPLQRQAGHQSLGE